ncbi:MAG: sulfotransferase domain-containing protein [Acidobacteria bacterium]|nr:sulfotransferase domain-containing protein [Acidobacteriota bacterium]
MNKLRLLSNHLGKVYDVALSRRPAGRSMTVYPQDLFIVSYPRSGNTWTRFLVGNFLYQDAPVTFANVEARIPSIYVFPDWKLRRLPRIFKSHDCFDPRYRRVIYIVRDPRDVAVSAYHYSIKVGILDEACPIERFMPLFMSGNFGSGLLADPRWGCWYDNVASWMAMGHNREFLLLRYEDMLKDPRHELKTVAEFLNLEPSPERLERAVQLSAADRMRELEKKEGTIWQLTKHTRQDKKFVRSGKVGNWQDELPVDSVAQLERAWGSLMQRLGYHLTTALSQGEREEPQLSHSKLR